MTREELSLAYREEWSVRAASKRLGISYNTFLRWAKTWDVPLRGQPGPMRLVERVTPIREPQHRVPVPEFVNLYGTAGVAMTAFLLGIEKASVMARARKLRKRGLL